MMKVFEKYQLPEDYILIFLIPMYLRPLSIFLCVYVYVYVFF